MGVDFSSLPVPDGQRLEAVGWSQDAGPLFRVSTSRGEHPLLENMTLPVPSLETDGYITIYPAGSQVLLARPDGFAVMIVYPYGKGWVVVTTLFTDFSSLLGPLGPEENLFVRNLLAWSKNPGKAVTARTGAASAADGNRVAAKSSGTTSQSAPALIGVRAAAGRKGDLMQLSLEMPPDLRLTNQTVLARAGNQEKQVALSGDGSSLSLEIPVATTDTRISYAVYEANGRAIVRGSVPVPPAREKGSVAPDRPYYFANDNATVHYSGMGKGEASLSGMGFLDNIIIVDNGSMNLVVPAGLPSGTYRMQWKFEDVKGGITQGEIPIDLCGYRIVFESVTLKTGHEGGRIKADAAFRIMATQKVSGQLRVMLREPGGQTSSVAEPVVSLAEGMQTINVPFSFKAGTAGTWELVYDISVKLPRGAGFPSEPVVPASGSTLFDIGGASVLAVHRAKTFYYEPSGPVDITSVITGTGRTTIEVSLDDKKVSREVMDPAGVRQHTVSLPDVGAGSHTVRTAVMNNGLIGSKEHVLTYGLRLPDLSLAIRVSEPKSGAQGPLMPVTMIVRNQGKSPTGPSRIALYEGDFPKSRVLLTTIEVPALAPRKKHVSVYNWPLYAKAGRRTLFAVADSESAVRESNKNNNTASVEITVPEILLMSDSDGQTFNADGPVPLSVSGFNLTTHAFKSLNLVLQVDDPDGKKVSGEKIAVDELRAESGKKISHSFQPASPPIGTYRFSAGLGKDKQLASVTASFEILPTLLLSGSFAGTSLSSVVCEPVSLRYEIKNAGNIFPSSGTIHLRITPVASEQPLYSKQFPLEIGKKTVNIDSIDLKQGIYRITLAATVENKQYNVKREFTLAEQPLTVSGPIRAVRQTSAFPRVLVWLGREGRVVEQAVAETIVKQAFEHEDAYVRTIDSEEDFFAKAMTGLFNTYVLFEPQEMPRKTDWLKNRLERGDGIVLIGSGETARTLAQDFGFTFEETSSKKETATLTFTDGSGLGLSGNMPVSGKTVSPRKKGATSAAIYSGSNRPAALVDPTHKGKLVVMPFSFSRSAFEGGPTQIYSLVLKKSAFFAAPETDSTGGPVAGSISISSPDNPVNARIRENLPPGSAILWSNAESKTVQNTITWELKAEKEPRRLLYLYQPPSSGKVSPAAEILYQCNGAFVSQGKVE